VNDSNILAAVFGLIGVIIGGLITAGSSYPIERRRDRMLREGNERAQIILQVRQASHLIDSELERAEISAAFAVKEKRWWPDESGPLELDSWNQYRAVVALALPYADWHRIVQATEFVHGINNGRARAVRENGPRSRWAYDAIDRMG
jgi:hypothetical protein